MTAVERAKEKVGRLFEALSAHKDVQWSELVRGGWESRTSLPSGSAVAHVDPSGYYEVYYELNDRRIGTLIAGSFEQLEMAQAGPDRPIRNMDTQSPDAQQAGQGVYPEFQRAQRPS